MNDVTGDQQPFPFDPDDDPTARLLRRALAEEAEMVQPRNGLDDITRRVEGEHRGRRFAPWLAGIAVAAVAGVVAGVLITGNDSNQQAGPPAGQPTPSASAPASPSGSATDATSTATTDTAGQFQGVPVYYIGQSKTRFWLYREFRSVPNNGAGYIASAVAAMSEVKPLDPDYSSPWQPSSVTVSQEGKALTVDLAPGAFGNTNVGSEEAALAIQQLVYTATAAASAAGTPADTVTITVDGGGPFDAWGVVRVGEPTKRADLADVQAPTWVTSPQEGETVKAGTVQFTGYGTAFEATFVWEVRKRGGEVVAQGNTMGGSMGTYGEFTFSTKLQPGEYTVEVYQPDMSDGESPEGPRMFADTKDFTVK